MKNESFVAKINRQKRIFPQNDVILSSSATQCVSPSQFPKELSFSQNYIPQRRKTETIDENGKLPLNIQKVRRQTEELINQDDTSQRSPRSQYQQSSINPMCKQPLLSPRRITDVTNESMSSSSDSLRSSMNVSYVSTPNINLKECKEMKESGNKQLEYLIKEIHSLKNQTTLTLEKYKELNQKVFDMEQEKEEMHIEITRLNDEIEHQQTEIKNLHQEINTQKDEITQLNQLIKQQNETITNLKEKVKRKFKDKDTEHEKIIKEKMEEVATEIIEIQNSMVNINDSLYQTIEEAKRDTNDGINKLNIQMNQIHSQMDFTISQKLETQLEERITSILQNEEIISDISNSVSSIVMESININNSSQNDQLQQSNEMKRESTPKLLQYSNEIQHQRHISNSSNELKRIHQRSGSNLSSMTLTSTRYLFIYKDVSDENDEDELFEKLQELPEQITPLNFWEGIKRELQPTYIVLIDNDNIQMNKMMIQNLYQSVPIICFTQNEIISNQNIIHFENIPSLVSLLNKQLL